MKIYIRSIFLIGSILFVGYFINSIFQTKSKTDTSSIAIENTFSHLQIPIINVDAQIEYVGTTTEGTMAAPIGPLPVGLYKFGAEPGQIGTAVIDGHSGWKGDQKAAFDNLHKLKVGDQVDVQDSTGNTVAFVVKETRLYNPNSDTKEIFTTSDGKSHLNLITCEGVWDVASKSYSERLVVFTDKL